MLETLTKKEYDVFEGDGTVNSIPESIVGGPIEKGIKSDFFSITEKLGLNYESREFYTKID